MHQLYRLIFLTSSCAGIEVGTVESATVNPTRSAERKISKSGRFIQSSRVDNAHEASDRSLSAYLMLVQQRRRVCVEAHIDCHPCRHPLGGTATPYRAIPPPKRTP